MGGRGGWKERRRAELSGALPNRAKWLHPSRIDGDTCARRESRQICRMKFDESARDGVNYLIFAYPFHLLGVGYVLGRFTGHLHRN